METCTRRRVLLPVLIAGFASMQAGHVRAQIFTNLYNFTGGSDGGAPYATLLLLGNTLYGTTEKGGTGVGTVFRINTNGTGFTNLYSFTGGGDGANPAAGLTLSSNILYGTANRGGSSGGGTVFAVNTDGTGFTVLHTFTAPTTNSSGIYTNSDGFWPSAVLLLSSNILYGAAKRGGGSGWGTLFRINTDGTGFTNLHNFSGGTLDGGYPNELISPGDNLYGTAQYGGVSGGHEGTVFKINADGTGFMSLHGFSQVSELSPYTNSDGANPIAGLVISGDVLYGTTPEGGSTGNGTVFKVNTDGTGFANLHDFTYNDGSQPNAGLILSGNKLYGTTFIGGSSGYGTVYEVNMDGTGFADLHGFAGSDSAHPSASLVLSGNILYGTASGSSTSGNGTVFSIFIQPELNLIPSGANVILTWPTNAVGFSLQSTTNLLSPVWATNYPAPVVVSGQNTVTNPISGTQQFYRLIQ